MEDAGCAFHGQRCNSRCSSAVRPFLISRYAGLLPPARSERGVPSKGRSSFRLAPSEMDGRRPDFIGKGAGCDPELCWLRVQDSAQVLYVLTAARRLAIRPSSERGFSMRNEIVHDLTATSSVSLKAHIRSAPKTKPRSGSSLTNDV